MEFVLLLVAAFGVSLIAVKFGLEFVDGQNRSLSSCVPVVALALFIQVPLTMVLGIVIGPMIALIIAGSIYKNFLDTTFGQGVVIALAQTILALVVVSALPAVFFGKA